MTSVVVALVSLGVVLISGGSLHRQGRLSRAGYRSLVGVFIIALIVVSALTLYNARHP